MTMTPPGDDLLGMATEKRALAMLLRQIAFSLSQRKDPETLRNLRTMRKGRLRRWRDRLRKLARCVRTRLTKLEPNSKPPHAMANVRRL
jgi:hypothetical protein